MPKDENKCGEMIEIMSHLHERYVPYIEEASKQKIESRGVEIDVKKAKFHQILLGGDQLTAARARSAIRNVGNGNRSVSKLSGFIPVVEDWHAKMTLLSVSVSCIIAM